VYDWPADDAETVPAGQPEPGGPVDPQPERPTLYATLSAYSQADRRPILPAWAKSKQDARAVGRWAVGTTAYATTYHASRSLKYAAKVALWAPVGAARLVAAAARWVADVDSRPTRDVLHGDNLDSWRRAREDHHTHVKRRLAGLLAAVALLAAAVVAVVWLVPGPVAAAIAATLLLALARVGRPLDRPILDRVEIGPRYVRLTAELVRQALVTIGVAGLRDPAAVRFPVEIAKDGPGHLARVNLPAGVEAVDVIERRGKLSSALRLPVDQVWPAAGPDHAGQLDLWVGLQPASKMGQPRWSLAAPDARTSVFRPVEVGTDQRQRPVKLDLIGRNLLIGGVPGSGKSYAARSVALAAALDPTVELKIAELKGTSDFGDLAPLCSTYVCGVDDGSLSDAGDMIRWGLAEAERRAGRIARARERGTAPEGKTTPELACQPGTGLHPVLILVDEAHELLADRDVAAMAERLIKRGRALGLVVVLASQVADRNSIPPNITRCVNTRWCLAVLDWQANDQVLGTGAYKRGLSATCYRPMLDAGWGVMTGLAEPTAVRSHYPSPEVTARIVARAAALRGGLVVGDTDTGSARRDVLDDVIRVWAYIGERPGIHWGRLAELLATHHPEAYTGVTAEAVSALVRGEQVPSVDVKVDGQVRKGVRLADIRAAAGRRIGGSGPGSTGHTGSGSATLPATGVAWENEPGSG
jgi:S-DNA-T family DNA segregation ATPase FtsK/SpoIIIE